MIWNKLKERKPKEKKTKRADTKRATTGFTMLLIPNSSDAAKTIEISFDRLLQLFTGAVAVAIIVIGLLCSMVVHNHKLKTSLEDAESSVRELKSNNMQLESTVSSLNDQIAADKEVFSKIEDTISKKKRKRQRSLRLRPYRTRYRSGTQMPYWSMIRTPERAAAKRAASFFQRWKVPLSWQQVTA